MAVKCHKNCIFMHIPKTGGSWVRKILKNEGVSVKEIGSNHINYDRLSIRQSKKHMKKEVSIENASGRELLKKATEKLIAKVSPFAGENEQQISEEKFVFCFVRNPLKWYESFWRWQNSREKRWENWGEKGNMDKWHPNSTLNSLGSDDFNKFIENVVKHRPGYATELMMSYAKPGIDAVGRQENLRSDLKHILEKCDVNFDKKNIQESKKVNVSKKETIVWDERLNKEVVKTELPSLLKFGYINQKDARKIGFKTNIPNHEGLVKEESVEKIDI